MRSVEAAKGTFLIILYFGQGILCRNIPCSKDIIGNDEVTFFTIDDDLIYSNYYGDFGPLNILAVYRFSELLLDKLGHYAGDSFYKLYEGSIFYDRCKAAQLAAKYTRHKLVVLYTHSHNEKRANAAFLIGTFAITCMGYRNFQEAALGLSSFTISLQNCLDAVFNAAVFGFFNINDFNYEEFTYYDDKKHGQVNWILPNKLLALPGPLNCCPIKDPMLYVGYFKMRNVTDIVALAPEQYDIACFENNGIRHHCLYIQQGDVPSNCQIKDFFQIVECAQGVVALHCKGGLGRTGTVIGAYLIKHYKLTAREATAWVRICRPGSILGAQQKWLECKERDFINQGNCFRENHYGDCNKILCHSQGIYNYCVPSHAS